MIAEIKLSKSLMSIEVKNLTEPEPEISCSNCQACCCRLEVMVLTDTGVPDRYIAVDDWGSETMLRLEDGWCSALDRDTLRCTIYENRPLICREFEMASYECLTERKQIVRL
jgi:Fe-S-cluster containining protein